MTKKEINSQMATIAIALKKYGEGDISLRELVSNIQNTLDKLSDQDLKDDIFDHLVALEEVHARTRIGDFDFEVDGRGVVDRAICEIRKKIEVFRDSSVRSDRS